MSKITIFQQAFNQIEGFSSMGEHFMHRLVINGRSKSTHENYLRQIAKLSLHYGKSPLHLEAIELEEFLRLFCQHISPHGFTRIRHYGFLSSASKGKSLPKIRVSLRVRPPAKAAKDKSWQEIVFERMGIKPGVCKNCGREMVLIQTFQNYFRNPPGTPPQKIPMPVCDCKAAV